ncbi:uncharacterized protein LOC131326938 [Rhododendron vialii]|uniref:uncharacterized protein LOC131326938 n=1 Tax=Rhododendron vialii TaxID=182163 RepID=UPI00265E344F|nr:uncharacterized protein LOC131326938 [Rhododendron vialii]
MTPEVQKEVKKEMERLFMAKFIRPVKYVEWISNIVPVIKKNGKAVDFFLLRMVIMDITKYLLQKKIDTHKTAFRCPGYIGLFEWIVMAFGLKNAGATYQRTMNVIFHDLIGNFMEVYIDDIVVKSHTFDEHVDYLRQVLMRMRQYKLKMNAMKCAFGVTAGNFLGFLVHKKGIEVDKDKAKTMIEAQPPTNKQELQQFLGQLKSQKDFKWEKEHQKAFEFLKQSLYVPQKAVKGQALADFIANHPNMLMEKDEFEIHMIEMKPWKLSFDGSKTDRGVGAGVVFTSPKGEFLQFSFQLDESRILTNNQAEYEALIIGLEIAKELNIRYLNVTGDSQLVIRQITGEYKCNHPLLELQLQKVKILVAYFDEVHLQHVYRLENSDANQMAQIASGIRIPEGQNEKLIKVQKRFLSFSIERDSNDFEVMEISLVDDWRVPIRKFLENPKEKTDRNIKQRAINYVIMGNDLFRKSSDEVLLLCIDKSQTMTVMGEVHEGTCGSHQFGEKMKWLLKRYGYYWPTIRKDCISYAKGCQKCQQCGPIQRVPAFPLQLIVKPWPFRGWAIDMIGEIIPHSSQQHEYVMVATDYFTKWTEAIPLKSVAQKQVIDFIEEYSFCRFGIPETITVDQASVFNGHKVMTYVNSYGVKILNSSPYYAQANGTSKRESTRATPYELVYGQAAVLPVEVNITSHRVAWHYGPNNVDFEEAIVVEEFGGSSQLE